jgi:hypothetical protein
MLIKSKDRCGRRKSAAQIFKNATTNTIRMRRIARLFMALLLVLGVSRVALGQNTKGSGGRACPAHWKPHVCDYGTVLCVDPAIEIKYDITDPFKHASCNPKPYDSVIMNSSVRGDIYLNGFSQWGIGTTLFWLRTLMLDASMAPGGDLENALKELGLPQRSPSNSWYRENENGFQLGQEMYMRLIYAPEGLLKSIGENAPARAGKLACSPPSTVHICASMIVLCVAPDVEQKYELADSDSFQKAFCDARPVGEPIFANALTGDPYKAGFSVGFKLLPQKFVKTISLSSAQIEGGDLEGALQKSDLRIPSDWETQFDEGIDAGAHALIDFISQATEKAKQLVK